MQEMTQANHIQYSAGPQGARQDYGGCKYYGGRGYHGPQYNYCGQGGRGVQHNGNWCGGRVGRVNSNLTHYFWTHRMCAHPDKYFSSPADRHQKDAVWCNKISESERNCI